jgi:hypothetical protein
LRYMEKAVSQSVSADSKLRFKALEKWTEEKDTYNHEAFDNEGDRIEYGTYPYAHSRDLPRDTARKAFKYIKVLTRDYPFQMRNAMGLPLWERFAEEWCDTGDESKALRAID